MGLGILGLTVLLCVVLTQLLLLPFHLVGCFQLPSLPWIGNLQQWLGLAIVLGLATWLLND